MQASNTTAQNVEKPSHTTTLGRVESIDILRALTMVLMIFVNDLWSLNNIPAWLGHVEYGVDGIGLADVIFPAFLFIVGLSLPLSIDNRRAKGETDWQLIQHVLLRSLALLIMGVFLVNGETINAAATGMSRVVWYTICCACFILIWNAFPRKISKYVVRGIQGSALLVLLILAIVYRGGTDNEISTFEPQWWGILGLIGWAYLVSATITVLAHNRITLIAVVWLFFAALSMISHAGLFPEFLNFIPSPVAGGTLTALTIGGVLTALIFKHFKVSEKHVALTLVLLGFAAVLVLLYAVTRPYWGLAKLGETPAWLFLCSAFTIIAFVIFYWIIDVYQKAHWFTIIKPAGTATLLCYLIPYFAYATMSLPGADLPEWALTGGIGLIKSFLFALLCVGITGLLVRVGIRFKV
ncbi:MAG TPA: DUF5009 domain-containing protein [Ohtaekwangia sp.]|nr:DUF5009 domain-containing protein [Ohtaekwangia sp.]